MKCEIERMEIIYTFYFFKNIAKEARQTSLCFLYFASSANWNLYNYLSNFPHFIGFPACPLVK